VRSAGRSFHPGTRSHHSVLIIAPLKLSKLNYGWNNKGYSGYPLKKMTPKERDIEKLKNKITESENTLKTANQNGPLIVAFFGIVSCLTFVMGLSVGFFILGLILVLSAVVWAYFKTQKAVKLKDAIFVYKMEIYRIENKPWQGDANLAVLSAHPENSCKQL
jgi:hypothetical protein